MPRPYPGGLTGKRRPIAIDPGVDIRARVTGYLSKIYFQDGADVNGLTLEGTAFTGSDSVRVLK